MSYVEFIVFIARVSHESYKGSKNEDKLMLHQKIDNCLGPLLSFIGAEKQFSFKQEGDGSDDETS